MRVVLDINVLISGLLWLNPSHKILKLVETGKVEMCFTPSCLEELCQVLHRPKFLLRIRACKTSPEELIASLYKFVLLFPDIVTPRIVKDDPDDDKIVACAEASGAEFIITGDPHLLKIKQYGTISILTPRKFLSLL